MVNVSGAEGVNVKAKVWVRMINTGSRNPTFNQTVHSFPVQLCPLAATSKGPVPINESDDT